jgi:hypothetical protein
LNLGRKQTPRPDPLPAGRGEGIKTIGGSRPLPELFQATGCRFEFSTKTIQPLTKLISGRTGKTLSRKKICSQLFGEYLRCASALPKIIILNNDEAQPTDSDHNPI